MSDFAGLLKPSDEQAITELVKAIKTSTGDEIAVVTQNSLDEFADPQEMALAYIEDWALGEKGKDNGLLILILFDPNSDLKQYRRDKLFFHRGGSNVYSHPVFQHELE